MNVFVKDDYFFVPIWRELISLYFYYKFKRIMEAQFTSFNNAAHVTSFSALSASIFKWLEEECKPQVNNDVVQRNFSLFAWVA